MKKNFSPLSSQALTSGGVTSHSARSDNPRATRTSAIDDRLQCLCEPRQDVDRFAFGKPDLVDT